MILIEISVAFGQIVIRPEPDFHFGNGSGDLNGDFLPGVSVGDHFECAVGFASGLMITVHLVFEVRHWNRFAGGISSSPEFPTFYDIGR